MKTNINSKGELTSDLLHLLGAVVLIVIGLFILFSISSNEKKANLEDIATIKDSYQTLQLARTFIQTPVEFQGDMRTVAEWVNIYFQLTNYTQQIKLRRALSLSASKILRPHLKSGDDRTIAAFSYYTVGKKTASLEISSTWNSDDVEQKDKVIYTGVFQGNVSIQVPVYIRGLQTNPSDKYIRFDIYSVAI